LKIVTFNFQVQDQVADDVTSKLVTALFENHEIYTPTFIQRPRAKGWPCPIFAKM